MNKHKSILAAVMVCVLTLTGCGGFDLSNILQIIGGALSAGETIVEVLSASNTDVTPAQAAQITAYVNGAANLIAVITAGLKDGSTPIAQVQADAAALSAQLATIGTIPASVKAYVTAISAGLAAALAELGQPAAVAAIKAHSVNGLVITPKPNLFTSPVTYFRLNGMHSRAVKLASRTKR